MADLPQLPDFRRFGRANLLFNRVVSAFVLANPGTRVKQHCAGGAAALHSLVVHGKRRVIPAVESFFTSLRAWLGAVHCSSSNTLGKLSA